MRKIGIGMALMFFLMFGNNYVGALAPPNGNSTCGWCGRQCTKITPNLRCLTIPAPSNLSCVSELDTCVIQNETEIRKIVTPGVNMSPRPTRIVTGSQPTTVMIPTKPVTTCIPRPPCIDGIDDGNGNIVYCTPKPGVVYCPETTQTPPCTKRLECMDDANPCMPDLAPGAPPFCPPVTNTKGDANGDGKSNLVDFDMWKNDFLKGLTSTATDFNKDGSTNDADFIIWKNAYLAN